MLLVVTQKGKFTENKKELSLPFVYVTGKLSFRLLSWYYGSALAHVHKLNVAPSKIL